MASPQALGEEVSATKVEISPHLDELLKDIATKLSAEELTNVVASIKTTFSGNFENQQDQDLYSCLQLFANQGLLSDQNLTLLERFVAWKSSKKEDIKQRIESFKLRRQLEVTPRQLLKGREVELDAVFFKLTHGKQPIANLYGSGGLGKTTLGREVCLKWSGKSVPVDLRGVTEMKDVYFRIMLALDTERTIIKYDENPVIEQLQKLKKESGSDVLLLLDNVDQFSGGDDDLSKGLNAKLIDLLQRLVDDDKDKDNFKGVKGNKGNVRLKVLLISRTRFRGLYADEHNYYELKPLDEGFSEEILRKTAGEFPSVEVNQMEKLVELCKGRPLFLNGIAAILRQRIATAEKVLESIEQQLVTSESQEKDAPLAEHGTQEREMWDLVSERLDEEQLPCLRKMFFLLPSDTLRYSAVAVSLFCRPFSEEAAAFVLATDPSEAIILLEGLRSSEVLSVDPEAKELLYDMHPLMRSFLRSVGNGSRFKEAYTKAKDRFCKLYMTKMQDIAAMLDEDYMSAFEHFDHDKANFKLALDISFKSDYLLVSREFHEAIMVCHLFEAMLEDTRQREKIYKSWAEATEEDGKEGSLFRAEMRCFEALQVLGFQGWKNAAEVLKLAEDSLKIGYTSLNDTEPYKLAWSTYLYVEGEVYYRRGSVPRALKSLYLSLEIMEDLLKKHTSTARCLNAIGNCYNKLGNHEEALTFYMRAYEMRTELSGSKIHLDLPFYKGQIGTAYEGQKQYDKAIQCYREALELSKQLKLSGILRLAHFHRNIANAYEWKGEFEKAYKPAMDAYEIRKDILGDHPDTARSAFQVGQICKSLEDFDEAEEFLAEAWRIEKSLEHGNHSEVRDRIIQSYTFILRGDRKKEFQKEALEFYQRLWMEEREFSYANRSIIDEINKLLHESSAADRKMIKKYEKEALQFYELAWNSPDLQQLPHIQREDILKNILPLCNALREKELLKKYQGEYLEFLEQQWEENKEMTTQYKIDILYTLEGLAARQGDEKKKEKYKMLYEEAKRGACFQKSIQSERLSGSEVVPSAIVVVGDSDGGNGGKIEMIAHGPESKEQFQVLEETKTIAAEETSTNRRSISQEGASLGLEKLDSGIQLLPKQEGLGKHKCDMQGDTSQEKAYKPAMDAYEIRKDILGDHPDTARSAFQVGQICKSLEDFDEAEEFLAEAWRIEKSLEHGNHSEVRDRIIQSYTFILRGDRKKEFQKEALEFYQRLWMEEREFSYANRSIIDEINKLLHESSAADRKMIKKYEKEALQFYELAWNSPDLQQLPHIQREDILQNILHLCNALREKELLKKYQGEYLEFLEQQWEENKEMTTQYKIDILYTLEGLAARQGDEKKKEKYKMLYEEAKRGACFQKSIQSERLSGSEVVPSAIVVVGDSDGGNGGKIEMIAHGPESKEQFQVLEETKIIAAEETSTNRRSISQEGASLGLEKLDSGIQLLPKQEGLGKHKCDMQGDTSQEEAIGIMAENAKERKLWSTTRAASGIITSEGGVVRVEGVQLVCPPGAVDNPVSIQITLEDPVKSYDLIVQRGLENDVMFAAPIVHLQPNGHLFKKPATLTTKVKIKEGDVTCEGGLLVLHGTEARDGKISWQDISQKSIINVTKKEVSIEIERFSIIENLWTLTRIRTKEIVSRLNLSPFNYTMSVLFKNNFSKHELALVFMSQDIFHEPYYRDHDASALVQLRNDGFKLLRSADGPTDKRIYNSESLRVSVCLGKDYKLPDNQQSSIDVTVESNVWWSTGHAIRLPLEAIKDVRILCGRIGVQGLYGHTSEYQFCEQDLKGYVKRLLGIEGAIFNLKPIAQKIGTPEETTDQAMKVWRDENDQLEVLLQPWLKTTSDTEDLDNMRKCLEELNEKDYKVKQRGQMHIRHLRELADKISNSKIDNVQLMQYFTEKVQTLCKSVLGDCCIELKDSVEDVEKAASSEDHVNYLEAHLKISQETASRYQQMCSLPEESIVKNFLGIVPHLIQDIKEIFRHEIMQDKQNGLRGLHKETLEQLATNVRETEQNNKILRLVCEVCKILEDLCLNNCDDQQDSKVIGKWGRSLGIFPMLDFLKPFFQKCPQHIRLQKRLELFSCRIRDIMLDVVKVDEVFMRDFFDVSSSLVHFAKFDPAKLVRFHVTYSANSSLKCRREGLKYNRHDDTFSELFYVRKEEEGDLLLHAVVHVHVKGRDCKIGAFQSVITFPSSADADFERCMTDMASVNSVVVAKLQSKDSQNIQVVLCSPQKERLSLLLDNLKQELHDVVDWKGSQITQCHLTIRSSMPTKPGTVLSLSLKYKWKSEAISLESDDFVFHADSSAESACTPDVQFQGLRSPMKPDEAALSLEPFMSQRTQTHPQIRCDELKIEHHIHHTYVTGHNCMVGDQTTLNTQTSTFDQRSLQPGPSSSPLRSITDNTSPRESTSSEG